MDVEGEISFEEVGGGEEGWMTIGKKRIIGRQWESKT